MTEKKHSSRLADVKALLANEPDVRGFRGQVPDSLLKPDSFNDIFSEWLKSQMNSLAYGPFSPACLRMAGVPGTCRIAHVVFHKGVEIDPLDIASDRHTRFENVSAVVTVRAFRHR